MELYPLERNKPLKRNQNMKKHLVIFKTLCGKTIDCSIIQYFECLF